MGAGTVEFNKDNFEAAVKKDGIVLIDFWASWCMPCRAFGPVYEKAAAKHPDIVFGKVDTQAQRELAGAFGIESIPTIAIFRDGVLLYAEAGALPPAGLEKLIETVRALDMAEVKAKVAELEAKHAKEHGGDAKDAKAADSKPAESKPAEAKAPEATPGAESKA